MGRGPARSIKCSDDGPRLGPAEHCFRGWAAARPRPSPFQLFTARPGPVHPFLKHFDPAKPGQAHHILKSLGPARPGPVRHKFQIGLARPGPEKGPMTTPGIYEGLV